jgi:hypothetical protein
MRIFLAPRSNETSYRNFLSTIENGVDYSRVEPHLNEGGKSLLRDSRKLFVWGNKETKKSSWEKMEPGDLVLSYKGREGDEAEGKFVYAGRLPPGTEIIVRVRPRPSLVFNSFSCMIEPPRWT